MPVLRQLAILAEQGPDERFLEILSQFQMRSSAREIEADKARLETIVAAIGHARESAAAEREGLIQRIKTIVLLTKEDGAPQRKLQHRRSGSVTDELEHAEWRLAELSAQIERFEEMHGHIIRIAAVTEDRGKAYGPNAASRVT